MGVFYEKKYGTVRRWLTIMVIVALILTLWPVNPREAIAKSPQVSQVKPKELVKKRTDDSKLIDNGNGTFTKKIYSEPIHNKVGSEWKEISTELTPSGNLLKPKNTWIDVAFKTATKEGKYATIQADEHTLSYSFLGAKATSQPESKETPESKEESEGVKEAQAEDAQAKVDQNEVTYPNVLPSVHLRNKVYNTKIKEDIILEKYTGFDSFNFEIDSDLTMQKGKDGNILFKDHDDKDVFILNKPYMYDSNVDPKSDEPAQSDDVEYVITKVDGKSILSIQADEKWLKDGSRKYPVYIDPSTNVSTNGDTHVSDRYPTTNYGSDTQLKVGYYDANTGTNYAYLKQDVSSLKGMIIDSAKFNVHVDHAYYFAPTANGLWLDEVSGDWSESSLTWKVQQDKKITSKNIGMQNVARGQDVAFDVKSTVQNWANGTKTNYGFKFHTNGNKQTFWKKLGSSESTSNKPYLSVTYHAPKPNVPKGLAYSNWVGSDNGFIDLKWDLVQTATGYYVWIYNGKTYQKIDVGNATSFSTYNKNIWPTPEEVEAGKYQLHIDDNRKLDGKGAELAKSPIPVYKNAGSTQYSEYLIRISAKTPGGETEPSEALKIAIPDRADDLGTEEFWTFAEIPGGDVNAVTGNMVLDETDLELEGREPEMSIDRTYNSRAKETGPFGKGWSFNYGMSLTEDNKGNVIEQDMDGGFHSYQKKADGSYASPLGVNLELKGSKASGWTLTDKDQTIYRFNTLGKLTEIEDINKNKLTLTYNEQKELIKITDPSKREFNLTYTDGKITKVEGPENRTWTYKYNHEKDYLIEVTDETQTSTKYGYYEDGQLGAIMEADDRETWYTYNQAGQLIEVIDPEEAYTNIEYSPEEKKTTVINSDENVMDYYYNDSGNPVKEVEDPEGLNLVTTYSFDHNNLTKVCDPEANKTGCTKATESYQYDSNGNMTKAEDATGTETFKYNENNDLVEYKDADGNPFKYVYDDKGNEVSEIDPDKVSEAQVTDEKGNIVATTDEMAVSENLVLNSGLERTTSGMPSDWTAKKLYDNGTTQVDTSVKYSGNQSVKMTTKSTSMDLGYVGAIQELYVAPNTTYTISSMIKTQDLKHAGAFLNTEQLNAEGKKSSGGWTDNRYSRVSGTEDWTRRQLSFKTAADTEKVRIYLEVDHLSTAGVGTAWFDQVQLEEGDVTTDYNAIENSSFEEGLSFWGSSPSPATIDSTQSFDGSQSIKMARSTTDAKAIQYLQVIPLNQKTASPITVTGLSKAAGVANKTDKAPNKDYSIYVDGIQDEGGGKTSYKTDQANFALGTHDWQRSAVTLKPDKPLKEVRVYVLFRGNNTGTAWFDNIRVKEGSAVEQYAYDSTGNYMTKVTDPTGVTESIKYDAYGNETEISDARGLKTEYTYDKSNQLQTITLPGHRLKVDFDHDINGNVIEKKVTSGDGQTVYNKVKYTYENDQLVASTDELGHTTQFVYDTEGDVISTTTPNGKTVENIDAEDGSSVDILYDKEARYRIHYDTKGNETKIEDLKLNLAKTHLFDISDRLTQLVQGAGTQTWSYNSNDELESLKLVHGKTEASFAYKYNESEQNTEVKDHTGKVYRFDYDEKGNIRTAVYANKVGISAAYDDNDNVTEVAIGKEDGTSIAKYLYEYDKNGNTTKIKDLIQNKDLKYTYDVLDQLTSESDPTSDNTFSYEYDPVGNRTKKEVKDADGKVISSTAFTYNEGNQLIKKEDTPYTYDKNGNRLEDGKYLYSWDAGDRLTEIKEKNSDKVVATYEYDEDGRRIRSKVDGKVTNYFYDGGSIRVLYETDGDDQLTRYYTYSEEGQLLSMTKANGETYYYQVNSHGDVIAVTDQNQKEVAKYTYDAWGNILSKEGVFAEENPYRYAGYRYDNETGFYYLMARYYQPVEGTFLSADPDPGDEDDPQTQNAYVYGSNNPLKYTDPDGHWINVAIGIASGLYRGYKVYKKTGSLKKAAWAGGKQAVMDAIPIGRVFKAAKYGYKAYKYSKKASKYTKKYIKRVKKKVSKKKVKKAHSTKKVKKVNQRRYQAGKKYKSTKKQTVKRKSSSKQSKYSGKRSRESTKRSYSSGKRKVKKSQKVTAKKQKVTTKAPKKNRVKREVERKKRQQKRQERRQECKTKQSVSKSVAKRVSPAPSSSGDSSGSSDECDDEDIKELLEEELANLTDEEIENLSNQYAVGSDMDRAQRWSDEAFRIRVEDLGSTRGNNGNIGFATVEVEGYTGNTSIKSHSTIMDKDGWAKEFSDPLFDTKFVDREGVINGEGGWSRSRDSEAKIFEEISRNLGMKKNVRNFSVTGAIKMFTERVPCISCNNVMRQFSHHFPNVKIEVYSNEIQLGYKKGEGMRFDEVKAARARKKK
ncbi:RHS repeat-associated core domain-containing protein [Marininema halotolerans]|uniref:RHS repeat-associated core domain-containing protein n=2 Tax=Marininema halotolerans TaxID=1155944 RepID=A0A1I6TI41_9BACL|nr:RHS repeat-associated core domain-containing protein [Marininema halotolerans]